MPNNPQDLEGLTGGQPTGAPDYPEARSTAVVLGVGVAVLAGRAPSIGEALLPGAGDAVFAGFAPTVATGGGDVDVTPGGAAVAVAGLAPAIAFGAALFPLTAQSIVIGYAPQVSGGTAPAPVVGVRVIHEVLSSAGAAGETLSSPTISGESME